MVNNLKNIFLLGFNAGSCGDYLCSKISNDANFYPLQSSMTQDVNRCELSNPFLNFGIDIKAAYWTPSRIISSDNYNNIDITYSEKNLIVPTHYFVDINDINLPRLVGVKLCSTELTPLFYILLWIKRWSIKHLNKDNDLADFRKGVGENLKMIEGSNEIINRGYHYAFEKTALKLGMLHGINLSLGYFVKYTSLSNQVNTGWHPYNLDNLFLNTNANVKEFSNLFNMNSPISTADIEQYHYNNIQLVENNFNKSYSNLISKNWLLELREWVKHKCPDAYSI